MKKLDKLLIKSFIGPLILTFCVSVFILLIQYMLKYFDDLVGKDLGPSVFAELLLYFSINMTPIALPLAILIASIMTYGNLGEHFELTAIKGSGISLTRTLLPTGILVLFISIGAFFSNNYVVPSANLRAYSLLYDIKHKKPSLDLREGQFYEGIPDYSIKVREKHKDGVAMSDVVIYDHKGASQGNKKVIKADSCRMYTIINDRYLMMELFNGNHYIEGENKKKKRSRNKVETFTSTKFSKMKMVFSLASFDLDRTDMELFAGNKLMKNIDKLTEDIDSMSNSILTTKYQVFSSASSAFRYQFADAIDVPEHIQLAFDETTKKQSLADSILRVKEKEKQRKALENDSTSAQTDKEDIEIIESEPVTSKISLKKEDKKTKSVNKTHQVLKQETSIPQNVKSKSSAFQKIKGSNKLNDIKRKNIASKPAKVSQEPADEPTESEKLQNPDTYYRTTSYKDVIRDEKTKRLRQSGIRDKDSTYITNDSLILALSVKINELTEPPAKLKNIMTKAVGSARTIKTNLNSKLIRLEDLEKVTNMHKLEKHKKISQAVACMIMFLIGAPLGAIIKKGGLGMPVIVSVCFFIIFYVLTVIADKWAKALAMDGYNAAWVADIILLPFGIFFLYQARKDAKLFDADFYNVWLQNLISWWKKKKTGRLQTANN